MSQLPPDKVTLEDLLHLKRAERPSAEFWEQFDRKLHAKQLAALVEKKPRWAFAFGPLMRISSLGALAALALAFALQEYYPAAGETARALEPLVAARHQAAPAVTHTVAAASPARSPAGRIREETAPAIVASAPAPAEIISTTLPVASLPANDISTTIPWLADALHSTAAAALPSLRSLNASLNMADMPEAVSPARSLASASFSSRARPAADPLAQISSPGEMHHARMLAALTDTHLIGEIEPASVSRVRERIASRLANDGYADDISRLGVEGTQVSFKF